MKISGIKALMDLTLRTTKQAVCCSLREHTAFAVRQCCPDSAQGTNFFDAERACVAKHLFEPDFSAILIKAAASVTLLQSCSAKHNSDSKEQQL